MSNENNVSLPDRGAVFWLVGNGDSTTLSIGDNIIMQVDICSAADNEDETKADVVEQLKALLPKKDGKPYLATFVLTHPDQDHCLGFARLLENVVVGELWHSPRVFREFKDDLCDDAVAFRNEAWRRAKVMIDNAGVVESGDRLRLVGWDDLLKEDRYSDFPKEKLSVPGTAVSELDGLDCSETFRAFIHAPFKDSNSGDRNETSVAMQVSILSGETTARFMLMGDQSYPVVSRVFRDSEADNLRWDVLLAPHHCSKSVMYWKDEGNEEETLHQDVLDDMESAAGNPGTIVSSSIPVPASNKPNDNPPHAKAKARYESIAPGGFVCTGDQGPDPIVFVLGDSGMELSAGQKFAANQITDVRAAVAAARGSGEPPQERVGFGQEI